MDPHMRDLPVFSHIVYINNHPTVAKVVRFIMAVLMHQRVGLYEVPKSGSLSYLHVLAH